MSEIAQEPKQTPPNSHSEQEWRKKFFAMGAECYYCKKPLLLSEATKDHRTPKCRGGSSRIWNIVPACLRCNQMKGWRTEAEFLAARPGLCRNSQPRLTKAKPNPGTLPLEEKDEPGLLKKVQAEREQTSWAWRNPA